MKELQTLALGLVVVFVDVSTPDWVADPIGWVLVLVALAAVREQLPDYGQVSLAAWISLALAVATWPGGSVAHVDGWLELLFGLPTLAFCFLLCDSLRDVSTPEHSARFRALCWLFALLVLAPVAVYGLGWRWLATPAAVAAVVADAALVLVLVGASDEDAHVPLGTTPGEDEQDPRSTASDNRGDQGKHRA